MPRPPLPPFNAETAAQKARLAELNLKLTRFGGAVQAFNRRLRDAQDTPA